LYVKFCDAAEKDAALEDEARRIFKALEEGDSHFKERWEWMVAVSLEELETILKRLYISVDHHMGESFYLERAEAVIEDGVSRGLFVEGEGGALIFNRGESETPALVRKSDGTTLYLTRDLATLKYRVETWHPERIWYVVDHAQSLHFEQVFEVASALGYAESGVAEHIVFGRMRFQDASMSTRKGNIIKLMDLLDEAAEKAGHLAAEKGSELPRAELLALRELMGVAAVKYGVLSQDRVKDIVFDWDKVVTLEGNSAPYLLYSYARGHSILSKAGELAAVGLPVLTEPLELELLRVLLRFPSVLEQAYGERKPHVVATHLYGLCQTFNRFYGTVRVADVTDERVKRSRVGLVRAFTLQLKAGLGILGIPVLERM
jgi:arginyl-tRNA synthetase